MSKLWCTDKLFTKGKREREGEREKENVLGLVLLIDKIGRGESSSTEAFSLASKNVDIPNRKYTLLSNIKLLISIRVIMT